MRNVPHLVFTRLRTSSILTYVAFLFCFLACTCIVKADSLASPILYEFEGEVHCNISGSDAVNQALPARKLAISNVPPAYQTAAVNTGSNSERGDDAKSVVDIATGEIPSTYYAVGSVLASCLNPELSLSEIAVHISNGSKANIDMIANGEAKLAVVQSDVLNYAHNGTGAFTESVENSALWVAGIYSEPVQILAKASIQTLSDLKGKHVCVGEAGSSAELNAWQVLNAVGITEEDITVENQNVWDGIDSLNEGTTDAVFIVAGAYAPPLVTYAATSNSINLISLSEADVAAIQAAYPFFVQECIHANTYSGQSEAVNCVAIQTVLVASKDLSEDAVYEITKTLFEKKSELEAGHAKFESLNTSTVAVGSVPLHSGAIKYYKEIGVIENSNIEDVLFTEVWDVTVRVRDVITLQPEYTSEDSPKHRWLSSDETIATVESAGGFSSGNVTGVSPGIVMITAFDDGTIISRYKVTVVDAPLPSEISIQQSYTIQKGSNIDVEFEISPLNATSLFAVECDNPKTLSCSTTGGQTGVRLYGLEVGTANITVYASNNIILSSVVYVVSDDELNISDSTPVIVEWDKARYESEAVKIDMVPADLSGKTLILHTNDVHGAISQYAKVAALKADFEASGATVILVDAGDYSSGDPNVSLSQGKSAIELMNEVGYDYATLGNHEFDYGWAILQENLKDAKFTVLTDVAYEGKAAFDVAKLVEVNGVKLGLFGLTTPETATKAHPGKTKGVSWPAEAEMEKIAQDAVNQLKADGADLIIGITHLGVEGENVPNSSRDLLKAVTGVDLLIDGHSHTVMTKGEGNEPIQSTGTKLVNVGVVVIDNASKKIEGNCLFDLENYTKKVEAVKAIADRVYAEVEAEYGATFAVSAVDLDGANKIARYHETNLGDLVADALLWFVMNGGSDVITVPADRVIALTNGGGIREDIKAGDVTKKAVNTVLPFGNTVKVVYVTGEALLEALEASTRSFPMGGFPQVSGIKFTIDDTKQFNEGEQYPGSTYYAPKTIERVTIENVNGKDFDPAATYAVITNDFLADGGDTYYAFAASSAQFDTSIPMDEAVMEYIKTELKSSITAAEYGEPRGRITILTRESVTDSGTMGEGVLTWAYQKYLRRLTLSGSALYENKNVCIAEYRSNGRFLRVQERNNILEATGGSPDGKTIILSQDADYVKLFLLDADNAPICECAMINAAA